MTSEEKYKEIEKLLKRLSDEMCCVVQAFYLWRALFFARSIAEVGEDQAKKNVEIINLHKNFFVQTENSHLSIFIIGIVKFYDQDSQALTLNAIIKKMREYKDDITAETLTNVYPNRFDKREVMLDYKSFDEADIKEIKVLRQKNTSVLENLKTIRRKRMAHMDIEVVDVTFIPNEVEKLINDTQEMFNKLQGRFGRASTMWDQMKDSAEHDTSTLLENLIRGEEQRKKEIEEKYKNNK